MFYERNHMGGRLNINKITRQNEQHYATKLQYGL